MSLGKYFEQEYDSASFKSMFNFGPFKNKDNTSDLNDLMKDLPKDLDFENKCK